MRWLVLPASSASAAVTAARTSATSPGLRISKTRELVGRPRVVACASSDEVLGRRIAQALELVPGAAEPTCAALDGGGTGYAGVVEALELCLSAAEPT